MRCFVSLPILSRSLALLLGLALYGAAQNLLVLKSQALDKTPLHLADIATIEASTAAKKMLASIVVPSSISADGVITKEEVASLLAKNLIDTKQVQIQGSRVVLFKKGARLSTNELEEEIKRFITSSYPLVRIKKIDLPSFSLSSTNYRIAIEPTTVSFAHIYLRVHIYSPSKLLKTLRASVAIERYIKAAVAAKEIRKGTIITDGDIISKRVRVRNSAQRLVTPAEALGAVAKRDIRSGTPIKRYMIEPDYAVKRKRSVKIIYQRGAIHIELLGIALENGNVGDIIRVKNLSSNKVLRCKVLSDGVVGFVY